MTNGRKSALTRSTSASASGMVNFHKRIAVLRMDLPRDGLDGAHAEVEHAVAVDELLGPHVGGYGLYRRPRRLLARRPRRVGRHLVGGRRPAPAPAPASASCAARSPAPCKR